MKNKTLALLIVAGLALSGCGLFKKGTPGMPASTAGFVKALNYVIDAGLAARAVLPTLGAFGVSDADIAVGVAIDNDVVSAVGLTAAELQSADPWQAKVVAINGAFKPILDRLAGGKVSGKIAAALAIVELAVTVFEQNLPSVAPTLTAVDRSVLSSIAAKSK